MERESNDPPRYRQIVLQGACDLRLHSECKSDLSNSIYIIRPSDIEVFIIDSGLFYFCGPTPPNGSIRLVSLEKIWIDRRLDDRIRHSG